MDDLAETVILNLLRLEGLSPMVGDATKPLLNIRRRDLRDFVVASGESFVDDPTNSDTSLRRNAVRHELLPQMNKWAQRDVIPIVARQANLIADDVAWLETLSADDVAVGLDHDCREVREWPLARQRRWVRGVFLSNDADGHHPPTAAEVERVLAVIRGDVVAAELSGSRRVSRRDQRLSVTTIPPATLSADE
jgi:tRNA(Ile)-lysidine synthase